MPVLTSVEEWLRFADEPMPDEAYIQDEVLLYAGQPLEGNILSRNTFIGMKSREPLVLKEGVFFHHGYGINLEDYFLDWRRNERNMNKVVVFDVPVARMAAFMELIKEHGYEELINGDLHGPAPDIGEITFS